MLKVCGVTIDHSLNYGSCLQAYALQEAVRRIIIDGDPCEYELIPLNEMPDYPKPEYGLKERMLRFLFLRLYLRQYEAFQRERIHYADCPSMKELPSLNQTKDAFVCGSDVIWNPDQTHGIGAYYLDFARKYKFSYAASFGKASAGDVMTESVRTWIQKLNDISCREPSGARLVESMTGRAAAVVADPVILLERSAWDTFAGKQKAEKKYIFSYVTHLFPEYERFVQLLSEKTGLPVKRAAFKPRNALKQGIIKVQSPQQWLRQLRDAEYVITNSFHATAFSVMFHKKFFTVVHGDKDKGINIRMNDFLSGLDLQNRIYSSITDQLDLTEPDYSPVDSKLERMRMESQAFLQRNLEAAWQAKQKDTGCGSETQC